MDGPSAAGMRHAARALAAAGNLDGAIAKLGAILRDHPDDPESLALLALWEIRRDRVDAAEEAATGAVKAAPEYAFAHRALGLVHQQRKRWRKAEETFRTAIELAPEDPYNRLVFAMMLAARNRRDEAEAEYKAALELAPDEAMILASYASLLAQRGDLDRAEELARRALHQEPEHTDVLIAMGDIHLRRGRLEEAREFALWALQKDAHDHDAISLLAQVKMRKNPVMGLWWRWATWMEKFGGWKAWAVVIAIYLAFQVFRRTVLIFFPPLIQGVVSIAWIAFAILTWVGPSILKRMIQSELKRVRLKPNF
jgi:tetratricopeptide (TPR) repeat protein